MPHSHPSWVKLKDAHPRPNSPFLLSSLPRPNTVSRIKGCSKKHEENSTEKKASSTQVPSAACRQDNRANLLITGLGAHDPWQLQYHSRPRCHYKWPCSGRGVGVSFSITVLMALFGFKVYVVTMPHIRSMLYYLVNAFPDSLFSSLLAITPGGSLITNSVIGKLRLRG